VCFNSIVLRELDKEKFNKNIITILDMDDFYDGCETNFKDILIKTIVQMISEITEKDGWNLQYFTKEESERLFIAFMGKTKMSVRLYKERDELSYDFKEINVKFIFSEAEKKKIAEIYLNNLFDYPSYFENCVIEDPEEIDINSISEVLSDKVYQLLSPNEIKVKFKDKIEKIISKE
jgi:hypothetical protein